MTLKQFFKQWKINKIKYIYSKKNLANAIIKTFPNLVLEKIILINKAIIRLKK